MTIFTGLVLILAGVGIAAPQAMPEATRSDNPQGLLILGILIFVTGVVLVIGGIIEWLWGLL